MRGYLALLLLKLGKYFRQSLRFDLVYFVKDFQVLDCLWLIGLFATDDAIQDKSVVIEGRNSFCWVPLVVVIFVWLVAFIFISKVIVDTSC